MGQPPRPSGSYPQQEVKPHSTSTLPQDKQALRNLIKRVQTALFIEGYYDGGIDGIMGPKTRDALRRFKAKHGLNTKTQLDAETLNALGITVY